MLKQAPRAVGKQIIRPYIETAQTARRLGGTLAWATKTIKQSCAKPQPDALTLEASTIVDDRARFEFLAKHRHRDENWIARQLKNTRRLHAGMFLLFFLCLTLAPIFLAAQRFPGVYGIALALMMLIGATLAAGRGALAAIWTRQLETRCLCGFRDVPGIAFFDPWHQHTAAATSGQHPGATPQTPGLRPRADGKD